MEEMELVKLLNEWLSDYGLTGRQAINTFFLIVVFAVTIYSFSQKWYKLTALSGMSFIGLSLVMWFRQ